MDAYGAAIMANNPVAYWPLQDRGPSARDLTNNSRDLSVSTLVPFIGPTPTQRSLFNGSSGGTFGSRTDNSGASATAYTIEGWFRVFAGYSSNVLLYVGASASNGFGFYLNTGLRILHGGVVLGAVTYAWATGDQWHHIMAAYSGGSYTMWRNGVQLVSAAITAPNAPGASTTLLAADGGTSKIDSGAAAHCAVYTSALTAADAMKHYQLGYGMGAGYLAAA